MPDFSTPAEHAFEAQDLDTDPSQTLSASTTALSLSSRYSIESTLSHILANDAYRVIALQFPDELLHESVLVYRMLMKGFKEDERRRRAHGDEVVERQCYVLGDSTYGSCCPDVLSSLHLPADILVHYGHACLTRRVPLSRSV
jgi:diphthamide biosynthesis protein 2